MALIAPEYHFLITSLPQLHLGMDPPPFTSEYLRRLLQQQLSPEDLKWVGALFWPVDHHNLLHFLTGRPRHPMSGGNHELRYWPDLLHDPAALPAHMQAFLATFQEDTGPVAAKDWLRRLREHYYAGARDLAQPLLREWLVFEQRAYNVLTALQGRQYGFDYREALVGEDEWTRQLRESDAPDFGMAGEWPELGQIQRIVAIPDALQREWAWDAFRWEVLEDLAFFEYFSLGRILAYFIQLQWLERWHKLTAETGKQRMSQTLQHLERGAVHMIHPDGNFRKDT